MIMLPYRCRICRTEVTADDNKTVNCAGCGNELRLYYGGRDVPEWLKDRLRQEQELRCGNDAGTKAGED